jgi:hypothetical protein
MPLDPSQRVALKPAQPIFGNLRAHQPLFLDREGGREQGMKQFLDEKTYRPGLNPYDRPVDKAS